jgi:predicted amidohydrolase
MLHLRVEQIAPKLGRVEDNLKLHLERLEDACSSRAKVVVFPELSLMGYLLKDLVPEVALTQAELVEHFQKGSKKIKDLEAVIGFAEESEGHRYYNSSAFLRWDSKGKVELVHVHRKVHLPTYGLFDEGRYYSAGQTIRAFESRYLGRCGILICEDAWHLSLPLLLSVDGPDFEGVGTLFIPSNSPARGVGAETEGIPESHRTWEHLVYTYACLLGVAVIYPNRAGVEDGLTYAGASQVSLPGGEVVAKAPLFEPAHLDVDLEWPEALRKHRIRSPFGGMQDLALLQRELGRILQVQSET